jgi:hypothetical protein
MISRKLWKWVGPTCVAAMLAGTALAQDGGGEQVPPTPRNNVKKAQVSARRPGLWIEDAAAVFSERQTTFLDQFGGAEPIPAEEEPASLGETMKITFLESFFDILNQMADQFLLALEASAALSAEDGTSGTDSGT